MDYRQKALKYVLNLTVWLSRLDGLAVLNENLKGFIIVLTDRHQAGVRRQAHPASRSVLLAYCTAFVHLIIMLYLRRMRFTVRVRVMYMIINYFRPYIAILIKHFFESVAGRHLSIQTSSYLYYHLTLLCHPPRWLACPGPNCLPKVRLQAAQL